MCHSADVLPHSEKLAACALTQRAKQAMDSVCELLTTSQPHFVFCFKLSKVNLAGFTLFEYFLLVEWEKELQL